MKDDDAALTAAICAVSIAVIVWASAVWTVVRRGLRRW